MNKSLRKRPASRRKLSDASSPAPADMGPSCGHSGPGCDGGTCGVRYVGPTTSLRDHHAVHAARGVSHVWTAAIVSGLAIVMTGAIAWTAVDAQSSADKQDMNNRMVTRGDVASVAARMDRLEQLMREMRDLCQGNMQSPSSTQMMYDKKPERPTSTRPMWQPKPSSTNTGASGTGLGL